MRKLKSLRAGVALLLLGALAAVFSGLGASRGLVSVTDFGAVPGDGLDDYAAFARATALAIATGHDLEVPAGTWNVNFTAQAGSLNVTGRLRVVGAGATLSTIKVGPDSPSLFNYQLFLVSPNVDFTLSDIELAGPASVNIQTNLDQSPGLTGGQTWGIQVGDCTTEANIRLDRVKFSGKWVNNIEVPQGVGTGRLLLELHTCDVDSYSSPIGFFVPNGADRTLVCADTLFRNSGVPAADNNGIVRGHTIYIHPNANMRLVRCRFDVALRYAVHMHSGNTVTTPGLFAEIRDCHFGAGVVGGVLLSEQNPVTWSGGTYRGGGNILVPVEATFVGVNFDPGDSSFVMKDDPGFFPTATLVGCRFGNLFRLQPSAGTWTVNDCTAVRGVAAAGTMQTAIAPTSSPAVVLVNGGRYFGGSGANVATGALSATGGAKLYAKNVLFDGNYGYHSFDGAAQVYGASSLLDLESCTFDVQGGFPAINTDGTSPAGILRGRNNYFKTGLPAVATNAQYLTGRVGLSTAATTSASSITVDCFNFDRGDLTGTATVSTIVPGSTAAQLGFAGTYTFRCVNGPTFNTAGNIATLKTAGARAAGSLATFDYDPARGKWDER